jgi:hypothetical protein
METGKGRGGVFPEGELVDRMNLMRDRVGMAISGPWFWGMGGSVTGPEKNREKPQGGMDVACMRVALKLRLADGYLDEVQDLYLEQGDIGKADVIRQVRALLEGRINTCQFSHRMCNVCGSQPGAKISGEEGRA